MVNKLISLSIVVLSLNAFSMDNLIDQVEAELSEQSGLEAFFSEDPTKWLNERREKGRVVLTFFFEEGRTREFHRSLKEEGICLIYLEVRRFISSEEEGIKKLVVTILEF